MAIEHIQKDIQMKTDTLRLVISAESIDTEVRRMAQAIDETYGDEPLVLVGVLKGACMFFADLARALKKPHVELDFVRLASYGESDVSCGSISFTKDVDLCLEGKHVLFVEDIVDSGCSLDFLFKKFRERPVASLRMAALIDKSERRTLNVFPDFTGFQVESGFLVGYGLDYAERYRNLPALYEIVVE